MRSGGLFLFYTVASGSFCVSTFGLPAEVQCKQNLQDWQFQRAAPVAPGPGTGMHLMHILSIRILKPYELLAFVISLAQLVDLAAPSPGHATASPVQALRMS